MKGLIRKITLDGFKSFSHFEFDLTEGEVGREGGVALVYGENGAGKSQLIESLAVLKMTADTLMFSGVPRAERMERVWYGQLGIECGVSEVSINPSPGHRAFEDIPSIHREYASIGGDGHIGIGLSFSIDGSNGTYRVAIGSDGLVSEESLVYRISKNSGEIFSVRRTESGPEWSFSRKLFADTDMRGDVEHQIRKVWGRHTLLSILKHEIITGSPGYISTVFGTGLTEFVGFLGDIHVMTMGRTAMASDRMDLVMCNPVSGRIPLALEPRLDLMERRLDAYFSDLCTDVMGVRYGRQVIGNILVYEFMVTRRTNNRVVDVPFRGESTGMMRLLDLFSAIMVYEGGGEVLADEVDACIHENMVREIIGCISREKSGQFIMTTQHPGLLEDLDPYNSFIVVLDSFADKSIHCIPNIERTVSGNNNRIRYTGGVFRGIPFTSYLDMAGIWAMGSEDGVE